MWPNALGIDQRNGGGLWARVSYCRGRYTTGDQTSVVLHPTEQDARDSLWVSLHAGHPGQQGRVVGGEFEAGAIMLPCPLEVADW